MVHVTWPHQFQGQFVNSVGWDLLWSTHIPNLKCLRLPAMKKWKAMPNVKILVLSHPLGDLGVTYRVYLCLDGKRVVNFLLAIIKLFSIAFTAAALLSKICQNRRFLKGWVVRSLLRAGVQPTLDPSAKTFMSVQCASPGTKGELVGVCGVCASCVGWRKG